MKGTLLNLTSGSLKGTLLRGSISPSVPLVLTPSRAFGLVGQPGKPQPCNIFSVGPVRRKPLQGQQCLSLHHHHRSRPAKCQQHNPPAQLQQQQQSAALVTTAEASAENSDSDHSKLSAMAKREQHMTASGPLCITCS